jgi:hypothetical protein
MTFKKFLFLVSLVFFVCITYAQNGMINMLDSGRMTSIRGLSVVDDNIVWASGSNGTVAKSIDGGKTFEWLTVAGYEKRDFRDIEAFDKNTALIMGIAEPSIILKTNDGGKSWYKVFEDSTKGMFLDAMDFADDRHGIIIGDPINKVVFISYTNDQGAHWFSLQDSMLIDDVEDGEAFFAASGTNIITYVNEGKIFFEYVSGGIKSKFYTMGYTHEIPIIQGTETKGANSIAYYQTGKIQHYKEGIIVGGDFAKDTSQTQNCVLLRPGQNPRFQLPQTPPHGYRSCVEYIARDKLITCGTSGVDISNDGGMNWQLISTQSFHVCQKAKKGNKVFLAGSNGKIAMLVTK